MATYNGSTGADSILALHDDDIVYGYDTAGSDTNPADNDTLVGQGGDDTLVGGMGADRLLGGNPFGGIGDVGVDFASYFNSTTGLVINMANTALNTGAAAGDTYISIEGIIGSNFNDTITADTDSTSNFLCGGAGADSIVGNTGYDYADYGNATAAVRADMVNQANNSGHAAGDTFVNLEALRGSNFNDTLVGNGNDNYIRGGLGGDSIVGGGGFDYADYLEATAGIRINLANSATNTGEAAGDTYNGVEAVRGGDFNDTLTGDAGDNYLMGWLGADSIVGGAGIDFADYTKDTNGLFASLTTPASNTFEAAGDTYNGIEGLRGGGGNDTLVGDAGDNHLIGGLGTDSLSGGTGTDIASYSGAGTGINASLTSAAGNTGEASGDVYVSIEGLEGSNFNDNLTGDANANSLVGLWGNDNLIGLGGNDTLDGVDGNDTLQGGTGLDSLEAGAGNDSVMGNRGFDTVRGDAGDDFMQGNRGNDWMVGGDGNDSVDGGAGFDTLFGGAGADLVIGNAGNDSIEGNFGADTIVGGVGSDTMFGDTDTDVYRYDALSLNTVDVVANTADSIMGGQGDLISMLGLIDELEIGNVKLNALSSNSAVGGSFVAGQTNVAFSGGDLMFDLNGDGVFSAASDFSIALNQGVTVVTYFASDDMFHIA